MSCNQTDRQAALDALNEAILSGVQTTSADGFTTVLRSYAELRKIKADLLSEPACVPGQAVRKPMLTRVRSTGEYR